MGSASADATTFTFKLSARCQIPRRYTVQCGGGPVQAAFERVLAPGAQLKRQAYFGAAIDHVEAVDDNTVQLLALQPFAALVATIAHPAGGIPSPTAFTQYGQDAAVVTLRAVNLLGDSLRDALDPRVR